MTEAPYPIIRNDSFRLTFSKQEGDYIRRRNGFVGCARRAFRPRLALAVRALVSRRDDTGDRHGLGRGVLSIMSALNVRRYQDTR